MLNESNVNSYGKSFPAIFDTAQGEILTDHHGRKYIDFFSGAGTLNYGHNHPKLKQEILSFLEYNHVVHCLDMDSSIKSRFLKTFDEVILQPRGLQYKVQFPGPTGTNAVEAAVKLARKVTGRRKIAAFTRSFHGMTATSLALSACCTENHKMNPSQDTIFFPFDGFLGEDTDTCTFFERMITASGSGIELPAAVILETVQGEGGINIAGNKWLQRLRNFTVEKGILLIVDDIQTGCGRTGRFFSFERAGIVPDMVLLSKSISGFGLPLSLILLKPELDIWKPGEHNGTFRSNNLALCTAIGALDFWRTNSLEKSILSNATLITDKLNRLLNESPLVIAVRGIGMMWGIEMESTAAAKGISSELFRKGLMIEVCGPEDTVLKILPPLTITPHYLEEGLNLIINAVLHYVPHSVEELKVLAV
ncbi:diaminobutyrate-2-oxoglutarate transaminase [Chitinophaga sp. W2I13]|uniref:diaminobutyrate--2-oxoglutarate transaminase n=1 Tax=Chitinophaga sp. W2I13 TaxID=3373923 RepID=UPI003D192F1D